MYKKVKFPQVIEGVTKEIQVPVFPAHTGSQQFLMDAFMDVEAYYKKECKITTELMTNVVPSGVVTLKTIQVNKAYLTSQNVRTNTTTSKETDFGTVKNTESVRSTMIPLSMSFAVNYIVASTIDQYMVTEAIIAEFMGVRKFFIGEYKGYRMLPVMIGFPDDYTANSLVTFAPGENDQRKHIEFTIEILTWLPRPLVGTSFKNNEAIQNFMNNVSIPDKKK